MLAKITVVLAVLMVIKTRADLIRKSLVFNEDTPNVFYCPQDQPISLEGLIIKAKPLEKLCEHEGKSLPDDYKSDCWNDIDETDFACEEKKRILLRLKPPGSENAIDDNFIPIFRSGEYKVIENYEEVLEHKKRRKEEKIKARLKHLKRTPRNEF